MTISFHGRKRKLFLLIAAVVLVAALFFLVKGTAEQGVPGAKNEDRVAFLKQCGWQVSQEPIQTRDVAIPTQFSQVYQNYNELNRQAGFDLQEVAGKTCRQYVYQVTNAEGSQQVHATLLVYNGKIVGGDISTAALDGFMKPLRQVANAASKP